MHPKWSYKLNDQCQDPGMAIVCLLAEGGVMAAGTLQAGMPIGEWTAARTGEGIDLSTWFSSSAGSMLLSPDPVQKTTRSGAR